MEATLTCRTKIYLYNVESVHHSHTETLIKTTARNTMLDTQLRIFFPYFFFSFSFTLQSVVLYYTYLYAM